MFIFPLDEGDWYVDIVCEGYQAVMAIGGDEDKKWLGFIAYNDDEQSNWNVGNYRNVVCSELLVTSSWKFGHKDLVLNGCNFQRGQVIERDSVITFKVKSGSGGGEFFLVGPPVMKTEKYNYVVSYGGYTDKTMEFGSITVCADERADGARGAGIRAKLGDLDHHNWNLCDLPPLQIPDVKLDVVPSTNKVNNSPPIGFNADRPPPIPNPSQLPPSNSSDEKLRKKIMDWQLDSGPMKNDPDRADAIAREPPEWKEGHHLGRTHTRAEIFPRETSMVIIPQQDETPEVQADTVVTSVATEAVQVTTVPVSAQPAYVTQIPPSWRQVNPPMVLSQRQMELANKALNSAMSGEFSDDDETHSVAQSTSSNRSLFGGGLFGKKKGRR
nr:putative P5 protein [Peach associated luteovirus]